MKVLFSSFMEKPDGVYFVGEDPDEQIILSLRRHFITNLDWMLITIVLFFLPYIVSSFSALTGEKFLEMLPARYNFIFYTFWYLFVFGYAFEQFISWFFNVFIVTNRRIVDIDFFGLLHRRISEAQLDDIEDITHQLSGASQVVFNYGTLVVQTAGEYRELDFEDVPDPARVQDVISDLCKQVQSNDD